MSERITEPYDPDGTGSEYDWDYNQEDRGPKILWGRVAILGAVVLLAFLAGRATVSEGTPPNELADLREANAALEDQNNVLEDQIQALQEEEEPEATPTETATETTEVEGEAYTVKRGDSLVAIAIKFYGDSSLDECIAEANGISDPTQLSVGQELTIPDESTCA